MAIICALGLISLFAILFFSFLSKASNTATIDNLLLSIFFSPLILGLFLYLLFYVTPGFSSFFYITSLIIFVGAVFICSKNKLCDSLIFIKSFLFGHDNFKKTSVFLKYIVFVIGIISLLVFLRTIFWPPVWDDQLYYIEQAYATAQTHSIQGFFTNSIFTNEHLRYESNTNIRPGLPMIFSLVSIFTDSLTETRYFSQIMIFYFFILTCVLIFIVAHRTATSNNNEAGSLALFFTLSTFYFIDHSISGFKELLVISGVLLFFLLLHELREREGMIEYIKIGILLGLIAFINYSGILIVSFLLLILIYRSRNEMGRIFFKLIIVFLLILFFSGFEIFSFLRLMKFTPSTTAKTQTTEFTSAATNTSYPTITINNKRETSLFKKLSMQGADEFIGYNITSTLDVYTKGKLQGFFQIQFYGFVFWLFLIILILRFRKNFKEATSTNIIILLAIYSFVFFDPIGLNNHPLAYVLAISHKYTVLIIPLITIIIGLNYNQLREIFNRIQPKVLSVLLMALILLDFFFIRNNLTSILTLIKKVMPVYYADDYYLNLLSLGNAFVIIFTIIILILMEIFTFLKGRAILNELWERENISFIIFLTFFFLAPFLFLFNSNYGIKETILYSFSSTNTKLQQLKGRGFYFMIGQLQNINPSGNVLLINESRAFSQLYFPSTKLLTLEEKDKQKAFYEILKERNIQYILTKKNSLFGQEPISQLSNLELELDKGEDELYKNTNF
jgi:4-amino-4-deoxy-L-arabinose transferase-like glycosyltransferase